MARRTKKEIMAGVDCVSSKLLGNNTVEYLTEHNERVIRLHLTDIIIFQPNGDIMLNSGGWQTVTTKARMNEWLPSPWGVYQERNIWYVSYGYWDDDNREVHPYDDYMTLHNDGTVSYRGERPKVGETKLLKKKVKNYVNGFYKALVTGNVDKPSSGDCWHCALKTTDGETIGDAFKDKEHLLSHIKEKYYVPSLLVNAIEEFGVSIAAKHCVGYWLGYHGDRVEFYEDVADNQIKSALRRHMYRRLGMGA